jgi:hypothetical protein
MPPKSSQTGEELREFEAGVAAITDSRYVADYTWAIHGRMRTIFTNLPAEIDFGQTCIAGEVYPEKRISLEARIPLESLEATVDSGEAMVNVERRDSAGKEFTISIIPSESLPPGPFAFPIRLHAQSAAEGALPRNRFMVLGEIIGPVFAVPSAVEFGIVREGETAEQNVVLQSPLGKPIEVSEARVDDGVGQVRDGHDHVAANRLECVLQNQNESSALSCLVRFKAATPGDWSRNVMFRTRLEDGRVVDVVVPVRAIVIRRSG